MMPALSRRALTACGWVFSAGISGWAVDFLLGAEIKKAFATKPAVIGMTSTIPAPPSAS